MDPETPGRLVLDAPAKINLLLRALGRRPDGYTELLTVFQTLALADQVSLERVPAGITVECDDPAVPGGEGNLAHRAAALFAGKTGASGGVRVAITKRIPLEAGLGGGSSDAAAVLRGMNLLFGGPASSGELLRMGLSLGSDVPFFLVGGTAVGRGRGEILEPLADLPPRPVVLVRPGHGVSTAAAYRMLPEALTGEGPDDTIILRGLTAGDLAGVAPLLRNDLEPGVVAAHPEVGSVRSRIGATEPLVALMTGSGSVCFGVYPDDEAADRAAASLRREGLDVIRTAFSPRR
jgi:4-diphosphocytidyl-2-C-methyl-D-erythritol kinase